ncbi:MAG TPA: hypothetical protein VF595_08190 [Tepidisphaeraceae bacterium]|jgi:hypothetical protein
MRRDFVPEGNDILCEKCGYVLNGLPPEGHCPECGSPVALSTTQSPRHPPAWEAGTDRPLARFQFTAVSALLRPKRFFKTMTAHGDAARAARFGRLAVLPALLFNTKAIVMHTAVMHLSYGSPPRVVLPFILLLTPLLVTAGWAGMYFAVVRLTTLESGYWGMRLPRDVVARALCYNAVHVSAASLLPWGVTLLYLCMRIADEQSGQYMTVYLYTLSAAVVIAAVYLFSVYATSMRSLMYANR